MRGLQWGPVYSTVSGALPIADVPQFQLGKEKRGVSLLRCQLDVTTPGPILVRFNSAKGVKLWVDQTPAAMAAERELNLSAGLHTLTFVVDRTSRQDDLRCDIDDKPGSPARVRVVGGK